MPFSKYFRDDNEQYANDGLQRPNAGPDTPFTHGVQLQIPQFIYNGAPTLAHGGGAEVLPGGMWGSGAFASSWFSNSGFTPKIPDDSFFQSSPPTQGVPSPYSLEFNSYPGPSHSLPPLEPTFVNQFSSVNSQAPPVPQAFVAAGAAGLKAPSPLGLPVYSASGFDLLSILSRVATRPNPSVVLGPVDLTCSFVVVDVRRFDHPIVYCSPTFCRLTGYEEHEIIGKNCRFLQSPDGNVQKGEHRPFTSNEAVGRMKKSLSADKECQISIINYRKGGEAFSNLVTVIPIPGGVTGAPHEANEVVYQVGFQVDLTEQPNAILQRLHDGSYGFTHGSQSSIAQNTIFPVMGRDRERKAHSIPPLAVSQELKTLLADPKFIRSLPITTSTTVPTPISSNEKTDSHENVQNQLLSLILLESSPDFVHIVSLKGTFLYVAPSVRRVLGYEPEELVGGSISDLAHPEDVVPLMRELKESSATGPAAAANASSSTSSSEASAEGQYLMPRTVDLLFRARIKRGTYVWVECRGRLHVEPGKGRKAIILTGRAREMPKLSWAAVSKGGGLARPVRVGTQGTEVEKEFWGTVSRNGTLLVVGNAVGDVLGWRVEDMMGKNIGRFVSGSENGRRVVKTLDMMASSNKAQTHENGLEAEASGEKTTMVKTMHLRMLRKDGGEMDVALTFYRSAVNDDLGMAFEESISPAPIIYQIRVYDGSTLDPPLLAHPLTANVFEELETSRGSSWQYELQQLKFANQRLEEEISILEAQQAQSQSQPQPPPQRQEIGHEQGQLQQQAQARPYKLLAPATLRRPNHPPPLTGRPFHMQVAPHALDWGVPASSMGSYQQQYPRIDQTLRASGSLKRSWADSSVT